MTMEWLIVRKPSALGFASGIVAGLGAVTPASGFVSPGWAMVIGLVSGAICFYGVRMKFRLNYDDSLDVVGVHGVGGAWGTLATGLFATAGATGLTAGNPKQVGIQAIGVIAVALIGDHISALSGPVVGDGRCVERHPSGGPYYGSRFDRDGSGSHIQLHGPIFAGSLYGLGLGRADYLRGYYIAHRVCKFMRQVSSFHSA
jgi:hypothetical protein